MDLRAKCVASLAITMILGSVTSCRDDGDTHSVGDEYVLDLGDGVKMEFVWVPSGTFVMGSSTLYSYHDATECGFPQRVVTISKGFWMGKYEVTQEQWTKVMGRNPAFFSSTSEDTISWGNSTDSGPHAPVERVSWDDCQSFIATLNNVPGSPKGFRLPTEAEWEYACRAGTTTRYYTGDSESDLERTAWTGFTPSQSVGGKEPNAWGLYDMLGNVWETCQDWYGRWSSEPVTDPTGPATGTVHVVRGGSFYGGPVANATTCRSVYGIEWAGSVGLRVARSEE